MCGIVGYVGPQNALPIIMRGLEHLAYRGYDSAGVACLKEKTGEIFILKEKGKIEALKKKTEGIRLISHLGIGHTRWATHGEPSRRNAHPHRDECGKIALVHNGIIENHACLKAELKRKGFRFISETDTEVAANLISSYYKKGRFAEAFCKAIRKLQGFFAFAVVSKDEPGKIFVFRRSNPLCLGIGRGENFIASDVTPLLAYTHRILYLEDDEFAVVTREKIEIFSLRTGKLVRRKPVIIRWDIAQAQKAGYPHFMLKEIHEQPRVLEETVAKRLDNNHRIFFDTLGPGVIRRLRHIRKVFTVSCGTAYHAGLIGSLMIEECVRIPALAQVSSEFRYSDPIVTKNDMVILITQSGETADTLAALREAKAKGALTLAVVNVLGSTIAREADAVIYTHAGPEICVASTKAYLAQLATLAFFSLYLGSLRKTLSNEKLEQLIRSFRKLPEFCAGLLRNSKTVDDCARIHWKRKNFLYLGRGYNFPTALEGALKLKEISYAHAHGYAAGEMKHGPIALIDRDQPVICIVPPSKTYDKMMSNIEEIRAREGIVITLGASRELKKLSDFFIEIPEVPEIFSPILTVIPLQLFAYKIAVLNGRDVDQPRNLAKSVTVE